MSEEGTKLLQAYEALIPQYKRVVDEVTFALEDRIKTSGLKIASVHGRVKTLDSVVNKVERKEYKDPLSDIHDFAGVRVVCQFTPDLDVIDQLIGELFDVHEIVDKSASLGFDKTGYQGDSLHCNAWTESSRCAIRWASRTQIGDPGTNNSPGCMGAD
jgi:putative GTP pyrophosphokinase